MEKKGNIFTVLISKPWETAQRADSTQCHCKWFHDQKNQRDFRTQKAGVYSGCWIQQGSSFPIQGIKNQSIFLFQEIARASMFALPSIQASGLEIITGNSFMSTRGPLSHQVLFMGQKPARAAWKGVCCHARGSVGGISSFLSAPFFQHFPVKWANRSACVCVDASHPLQGFLTC